MTKKKSGMSREEFYRIDPPIMDGGDDYYFRGYRELSEEEIEALRQDLVDTYKELDAIYAAEAAERAQKAKKAAKPKKPPIA